MLLRFTLTNDKEKRMKNIIKISVLLLVFLICNDTYSQTHSIDNSSSPIIAKIQNNPDQFKHITSQTGSLSNSKNISTSNNVYIQQIGNKNDIISNTRSLYSDISLLQKGNNNEILLDITAGKINENVLQTGVNNSVVDLNAKGSILHSTAVLQKGANQNLIMLGSNSISDNMIILMQGKRQTILVRNIKN